MSWKKFSFTWILILLVSACDHPEKIRHEQTTSAGKAVNHPDRPTQDLSRDKIRQPHKVLDFFDISTGDKILELLAADGYYTELLSHCVGEKGKVYMQNNQKFYDFQTDKGINQRLRNNRLANVVRLDNELSSLRLENDSIDKLLMILVLHDFYWMEENVERVIQQSYRILRPGGLLGIIDHQAKQGSGAEQAKDINGTHRIDKSFVIKTMVKHGFILDKESNALNQPLDDGSKAFFDPTLKGKPTNRFMLRFKKP